MFTGLIERKGRVTGFSGGRLVLDTQLTDEVSAGDSIAVDGACLTVSEKGSGGLVFHCSPETVSRTVISQYRTGLLVNLERPLTVSGRLHGHIVTGHVDGTGSVLRVQREGGGMTVWVSYPSESASLLVPKGSVAVSGISLTVADLDSSRFSVSIIPETVERTTAGSWRPGTRVNLEFDLLGKYVQKQIRAALGSAELRKYIEQ